MKPQDRAGLDALFRELLHLPRGDQFMLYPMSVRDASAEMVQGDIPPVGLVRIHVEVRIVAGSVDSLEKKAA